VTTGGDGPLDVGGEGPLDVGGEGALAFELALALESTGLVTAGGGGGNSVEAAGGERTKGSWGSTADDVGFLDVSDAGFRAACCLVAAADGVTLTDAAGSTVGGEAFFLADFVVDTVAWTISGGGIHRAVAFWEDEVEDDVIDTGVEAVDAAEDKASRRSGKLAASRSGSRAAPDRALRACEELIVD